MQNILFWNLKRNAIEDYIVECIVENNVDVAVFSEYQGIDFSTVENSLGKMYGRITGIQDDGKVSIIAKKTHIIEVLLQNHRYSIYSIKTCLKDYILGAVHLEDRRNYQTSERTATIRNLISDLEQVERLFECHNTIVIGDFNANPYDEEVLDKHAFNATLFKTVINQNKTKRFYNPILHYISEDSQMYGSFYYDSGSMTPYWHCLDQVLVRKNLANCINNLQYLRKVNEHDLMKKQKPNKQISDHLPLLVSLMEIKNGV